MRRKKTSNGEVKEILGLIIMIGGIILGAYLGIYVMFIGGIVDLINVIKDVTHNADVSSIAVAIGIAKIIFASFVGSITIIISISVSKAFFD